MAARTVVEKIVETLVTTSGGAEIALVRTSRTPASAGPVTDLLRDLGNEDEADGSGRLRQSRS